MWSAFTWSTRALSLSSNFSCVANQQFFAKLEPRTTTYNCLATQSSLCPSVRRRISASLPSLRSCLFIHPSIEGAENKSCRPDITRISARRGKKGDFLADGFTFGPRYPLQFHLVVRNNNDKLQEHNFRCRQSFA